MRLARLLLPFLAVSLLAPRISAQEYVLTSLTPTVTTAGSIVINNDIVLQQPTVVKAAAITFNGAIGATAGASLTIECSGPIVFKRPVGTNMNLSSLTTGGTGETHIASSISAQTVRFNNAVRLDGPTTVFGTDDVTFASRIDGANTLTINALKVTLGGPIGQVVPITSLGFATPFPKLTILTSSISTTGAITFPFVAFVPSHLTLTSGFGGDITLNSDLFGGNLVINTAGTTRLGGDRKKINLASLVTDSPGRTEVLLPVEPFIVTGSMTFNDPVTILSPIKFAAGGDIAFASGLNTRDGGWDVELDTPGTVTLTNVGTVSALSAMQLHGPVQMKGTVNVNGALTFPAAVTLTGDTSVKSTATTFSGPVNGAFALIAQGPLTFEAPVGATAPLHMLKLSGPTIAKADLNTTTSQNYGGTFTAPAAVALRGSSILFFGGPNAVTASAGLRIVPATASPTLGIAPGFFPPQSIGAIAPGTPLTIGDSTSTSGMVVGGGTWLSPTTFTSGGPITISGTVQRAGGVSFGFVAPFVRFNGQMPPSGTKPSFTQDALPMGARPAPMTSPSYFTALASGISASSVTWSLCPAAPNATVMYLDSAWRPMPAVMNGACADVTVTPATAPSLSSVQSAPLVLAVGAPAP